MRSVKMIAFATLAASCFHTPSQAQQPYAGMHARPIKAFSEQQIADLRAGRGMGLALPAELNGYPGPMHVLELKSELGLSEAQRNHVQKLFDDMKSEALPIGEKLIEMETHLDRSFAAKTVTTESLARMTEHIGQIQGALRAAHLRYHLKTADVLSGEQVRRYGELRGYAHGAGHPSAPQHQHHGHKPN